jgi:hypothetical protein
MPCACIADNPKYPQNEEWGPITWRIFHTVAEKGGLQTDKLFQADEGRIWPLFVKSIGPMIPCPYCRDHFTEYLAANPFTLPGDTATWNVYIRIWFYNFHESVNQRLGKPSFPFDQLRAIYGNPQTIQANLDILEKIQQRAMKLGGVTILSWQAWVKHLRNIRAFL